MKYVEFDEDRERDLVLLGRVAIDFNPAYNDQVKEEFKPLKKVPLPVLIKLHILHKIPS